MKKSAIVTLLVLASLLLNAAPSLAWHSGHFHGHVVVGVGPWWGWGAPYPYGWWGPPYYPPQVVIQEPPTYIEQPQATAPSASWYYCPSAKQYYPNVSTCPEDWVQVPPRAE